jgi:DnaK suppressor protein
MRRDEYEIANSHWRTILETRWRERLAEVTELSVAYHSAAAGARDGSGDERVRQVLRQTVAARQRLAATEEALSRLLVGGFGLCEQCGAPVAEELLVTDPERRYCPDCAAGGGAVGLGHADGAGVIPVQRRVTVRRQ